MLQSATSGDPFVTTTPPNGVALRVSVLPWTRPDLGLSGYLVTGQPTSWVERQVRGFRTLLLLSSALILLAAFIASWSAAGRALRPLKTMAHATDEIGATRDLGRRLPVVRRKDELGRLTTSFNGMLERLQGAQSDLVEALATQRRFVADASHELRTPLTTIRANAGFLLARPDVEPHDREAALQNIAAESDRMGRLVEDLLTLARADAGQRLERGPLDLRPLVHNLVRQAQRLHSSRDVRLAEPEEPGPIVVEANDDALRQLLWILIDNAVKQTQRGGRIEIRLAEARGCAALDVRDDGPGIPAQDRERIFERFHQADRARTASGAGLGLAIARWIVDQHGGRIAARDNGGADRGATFTVELPLAASVSPDS
ncbi:MAG: HAMP domain-containing sensor histidine kinase [Thermomicrobiales bacterium]